MSRMSKVGAAAVAVGALSALAACSDRLDVPNFQNPTAASVVGDPAGNLPFLATGVLRDDRGNAPGYILGVGILGREVYNYTPTEGRNTSGFLTSDVNNNTSFGATSGSLWNSQFFTIRDAFNTLSVVESAPSTVFSDAQKNSMRGLLATETALADLYLINARDSLGIPVDVYTDPAKLAPFVSRDSAFNFIQGTLDKAYTQLQAGGSAFPFTLHSGFTGFSTPSTYAKFNRALAARVAVYRASLGTKGCGTARSAACYQIALTDLQNSFIDGSATGSMTTGVYNVYSAAANDVANSVSNAASSSVVAHAKSDSGIMTRPDGSLDLRFTTKFVKLAQPKSGPATIAGVPTNWDHTIYPDRTSPISIIRNEELILLRAEAEYYTGDQASALNDINAIRTRSGGLAARGAFTSETDFVDELLYNRRLSLTFEGHRWVDMRRFNRLNQLTIDVPSHIVVSRLVIPQTECLVRSIAPPELKAPGC
ncbi:MAG TPA: RagB/SusD family nutrient uptake outer membrane protein [Gemmatimonadaceae bacterium]